MALPPEVRTSYVSIVDTILAESDLTTISEKKIRKGIQEKVEYDITPQKAAIKELIMERFDLFNARQQNGNHVPVQSVEKQEPTPTTNGYHDVVKPEPRSPPTSASPTKRDADSSEMSELADQAPSAKKRKTKVEDDAALAARLQAEEERMARPTRGGTSRKAAPTKKKTPKKKQKTSARVGASDDSDIDSSESPKPQRNTGFHKPMNLSPALSSLLGGEVSLSRPQTTKRIWDYIKSNALQDPNDKRFIICDDRMKEVFRLDKVHMFQMTKILNQNLYNPDE